MKKCSKAVSERHPQFKKKEPHPLEKYVGRHVSYWGQTREVVGYTTWLDGSYSLIVDASKDEGWNGLGDGDVIFKKCEGYLYASVFTQLPTI